MVNCPQRRTHLLRAHEVAELGLSLEVSPLVGHQTRRHADAQQRGRQVHQQQCPHLGQRRARIQLEDREQQTGDDRDQQDGRGDAPKQAHGVLRPLTDHREDDERSGDRDSRGRDDAHELQGRERRRDREQRMRSQRNERVHDDRGKDREDAHPPETSGETLTRQGAGCCV